MCVYLVYEVFKSYVYRVIWELYSDIFPFLLYFLLFFFKLTCPYTINYTPSLSKTVSQTLSSKEMRGRPSTCILQLQLLSFVPLGDQIPIRMVLAVLRVPVCWQSRVCVCGGEHFTCRFFEQCFSWVKFYVDIFSSLPCTSLHYDVSFPVAPPAPHKFAVIFFCFVFLYVKCLALYP